jgi:hypothetical protein
LKLLAVARIWHNYEQEPSSRGRAKVMVPGFDSAAR